MATIKTKKINTNDKAQTNGTNGVERKKRECPISREDFTDNATPVEITIDGQRQVVDVKEFSTGSFGWYMSGKIVVQIEVNGKMIRVPVQAGITLTCIGSKEV